MTPTATRRVLVTGGVRSGKSRFAEGLLADLAPVTYLAVGPEPDYTDPEWAARIAAHRERRPASWRTVEGPDAAGALRAATGAVLLDCLGTWLTATVDRLGTWDEPVVRWRGRFDAELEALVAAIREREGISVAVTNEVGWGLVSEHRSGRVFTDLLGVANQAVAAACDEVYLVVAGRSLRL